MYFYSVSFDILNIFFYFALLTKHAIKDTIVVSKIINFSKSLNSYQ
jgi:hypothetical protein